MCVSWQTSTERNLTTSEVDVTIDEATLRPIRLFHCDVLGACSNIPKEYTNKRTLPTQVLLNAETGSLQSGFWDIVIIAETYLPIDLA